MKKTIIWLISIAAVAALGVYLYVFHFAAKHPDPLDSEDKVEISAEKLYKDYVNDETMADSLYNGKAISVKGIIANIELNTNRYTITFNTNDSNGAVICEMDTVENASLSSLKPGADIHVVGFCNGMLMDVQLDRGKLAK
jgi:hypothetical protein